MAEQRRFYDYMKEQQQKKQQQSKKPAGVTEEQYLRHLESGENATPMSERPPAKGAFDATQFDTMFSPPEAFRNFAVGIPRNVTDLISMGGLASAAGQAGYKTFFGTEEEKEAGFGENFAMDLYGKQGLAEANQWLADETENHMARLPAHLRNEVNKKRIVAALEGSKTRRDMLLKYADPLYRFGQEAAKEVNKFAGLPDPNEETTTDELTQIAGGSIIPVGLFAKPAISVANAGTKALVSKAGKKALELVVAGNTGTVKNAVSNFVVQSAVNQGMRAATDQPSVITGDAMLAEEIAVSGELTQDAGQQHVQTPSGKVVTPPPPVKDAEDGLGGWQKAAAALGVATAAIVIGAARGHAAKGIGKNIIDDTIHNANQVPTNLVPTPKDQLRPTLTTTQRRYSDYVNRVKPTQDVARKALAGFSEADVQKRLEIIERLSHEAAPVNIFAAAARTYRYGDLPGLNRKTIPTEQLEKLLSTFKPNELAAWTEGMQLKHLNGEYAKRLNSLQDEIDAAIIAHHRGVGTRADIAKARGKLATAQTTSPFDAMSVTDARSKMAQFDANMRNQAGERMFRQIANDVREAAVKRGHYTQAEMDKITRSNPYYVPQINDPVANATWWRKAGSVISDEFKGRSESTIYEKRAALFAKGGEHERVKNPVDPVTALKNSIHDFHAYDRKNEAIAQFVNTVAGTPEWGKAMREAHKSTSMSDFNAGKVPDSVLKNNRVVVYSRNGRLHYVEMADAEVARSLAYNPGASMMMLDAARRFHQARLTGPWAPWFAWKGAKYEITPTRMLKKENRSFGIIDSAIRGAFPNARILKALDYVPDGTVKLQMISHAFGDITNNAVEAMARKIASDLSFQSGFFNWVAQIPGGRQLLYQVGDIMTRSFNDSMYTLLHKEGVLGQTFSNEPTIAMLKGYDSAEALTAAFKPASIVMRGYRSVLDSVRSSAKVTFFAQNYQLLKREYKAKGQKIPKSEIDKLIHETKVSSGDMTISPGKPGVSKAVSTSNYLKTNMNSLAALGEAAVKRPADFGLRFMTTAVAPKLWTVAKISAVPALAQWYWNDLNDRQRAESTPFIKPEYFIEWAQTGQLEPPPLTPDHMMLMPDAPETIAFTSPMMAAIQALGGFGTAASPKNAQGRPTGLVNAQQYMDSANEAQVMIGRALDSLISIPVPSLVNAAFGIKNAELQKIGTGVLTGDAPYEENVSDQPEMFGYDSELARRGWGVISALFGQTTDMIKHASNESGPDDDWVESAGKLLMHTANEWKNKIPDNFEEFGAGTLFGTQRRLTATTGTRERMFAVHQKIDKIVEKRSLERRGLTDQKLTDPHLLAMRDELIGSLNRHGMERLKKKRSNISRLLEKLEKERYKMSTANFDSVQRRLYKDMQHINVKQQHILDTVTNSFMHPSRYGMSAEDAIDLLLQQ